MKENSSLRSRLGMSSMSFLILRVAMNQALQGMIRGESILDMRWR